LFKEEGCVIVIGEETLDMKEAWELGVEKRNGNTNLSGPRKLEDKNSV